jgi:hypothetical protein
MVVEKRPNFAEPPERQILRSMKTPGPIPGVLRYACEFNAMSRFKDATPIFSRQFSTSIYLARPLAFGSSTM